MIPRTVLQYQIVEKIGAGGMGEIYKARDTRLNRFVVMKVLSAAMSGDPERRRRFIQEARTVSALNHPNIITIYDVVNEGETDFMVVEFVDGKTLLELIPKGGLPVPEVIRYATQMAEALCAAHAAGIIHRDLKPANVMVTGSGLVKVLDFGLAKIVDWPAAGPVAATTVTLPPAPLTIEGTLLGTVNYMSPEQAEGKKLDARSDIFSFGAVLYEMLTGHSAFRGDTIVATLTAVLRDDVRPIRELSPQVPADLDQIVTDCLRKDAAQRPQSMQQIQAALSVLKRRLDSAASDRPVALPAPRAARRSSPVGAIVAVLFVIAACASGYWWMAKGRPSPSPQTPAPMIAHSHPAEAGTAEPQNVIPAASLPPPADPVTVPLPDGVLVRLTLEDDIPADAAEGTPIQFTVASDVRVNSIVVIRKGAIATGSIVDAAKKKVLGVGGKTTIRIDSVEAVDGSKIALRVTPARHGDGILKRAVDPGARRPKEVASSAGTFYAAFVDGAGSVLVKK